MQSRAIKHINRALYWQNRAQNQFGNETVPWRINYDTKQETLEYIGGLLHAAANANASSFVKSICVFYNIWDGWNDAIQSILSDSTGQYTAYIPTNAPLPSHIKQLCKEVWNLALRLQAFSGFLSLWHAPENKPHVQPFPDLQYQGKEIEYTSVVRCMNDIKRHWGPLDNENAHHYLYLLNQINTILSSLTPTQIKSFTPTVRTALKRHVKSLFDPYFSGHLDNLLISVNTIQNPIVKSERQQQASTSQSPSSSSTGRKGPRDADLDNLEIVLVRTREDQDEVARKDIIEIDE